MSEPLVTMKWTLIGCITLTVLANCVITSSAQKKSQTIVTVVVEEEEDTVLQASLLADVSKWGPDKCDEEYKCQLIEPILDFHNSCLKEQNILRSKHKVPPLTTSEKLIDVAKRRAMAMVGKNININHMPDNPYGENLHQILSSPLSVKMECIVAVNAFYKEIANYDFKEGKSKNGKSIGHFTQLVWNSTIEVGCAQAIYKGSDEFKRAIVVCEYHPYGNSKGAYVENVFSA